MTLEAFEKKYQEKGGIQKLSELRSLFFSQKYIAEHFGVSNERVRQWMLQFFGHDYDPREERRESIIVGMVEFALHNEIAKFRFAFQGTQYYKEALSICRQRKIYD